MDRSELRKMSLKGVARGGSRIAAAMTPSERSARSKKAAATKAKKNPPKVEIDLFGQRAKAQRAAARALNAGRPKKALNTEQRARQGARQEAVARRLKASAWADVFQLHGFDDLDLKHMSPSQWRELGKEYGINPPGSQATKDAILAELNRRQEAKIIKGLERLSKVGSGLYMKKGDKGSDTRRSAGSVYN